jgi:pimeloyl-ACP methyl ester carboxylesterase
MAAGREHNAPSWIPFGMSASCGPVMMLNRRATGLSDRVCEVQSLETTMDVVRAFMDAVGSERAVLWTGGIATGIGALFAATYPERCAGLVLFDPRVKGIRSYKGAVAQMRLDADGAALDRAWAEGRQMGADATIEFAVALDETNRDELCR